VLGSHPKDRQGPKPTLKFVHGLLVPGCALGRMVVEPTATCCPAWTALAACVHRVGGQGMQHVVRQCTFLGYLGAVGAMVFGDCDNHSRTGLCPVPADVYCADHHGLMQPVQVPHLHVCERNWV
jgi:hypothetical protein